MATTVGGEVRRIVDGSAWRDFCRALEQAGEVLLREEVPTDPLQRAEGIRYLTRLLRAGLEQQLEYGDPRFSGFYQLSNQTLKIGNDNPDNVYLNANVSGAYEYRISGTRGTMPYLSFGTKSGGYELDGTMVPTGKLDGRDLQVRPDGSFEIIVSCKPHPGNWLPVSTDGPFGLIFRLYDTPLTTGGEVSDTMMPRVVREECR